MDHILMFVLLDPTEQQ